MFWIVWFFPRFFHTINLWHTSIRYSSQDNDFLYWYHCFIRQQWNLYDELYGRIVQVFLGTLNILLSHKSPQNILFITTSNLSFTTSTNWSGYQRLANLMLTAATKRFFSRIDGLDGQIIKSNPEWMLSGARGPSDRPPSGGRANVRKMH